MYIIIAGAGLVGSALAVLTRSFNVPLTIPKNARITGQTVRVIVQGSDFPKECLFYPRLTIKPTNFRSFMEKMS